MSKPKIKGVERGSYSSDSELFLIDAIHMKSKYNHGEEIYISKSDYIKKFGEPEFMIPESPSGGSEGGSGIS